MKSNQQNKLKKTNQIHQKKQIYQVNQIKLTIQINQIPKSNKIKEKQIKLRSKWIKIIKLKGRMRRN